MTARRRTLALLAIAASLGQAACGYALAGRGSFLPSYIRTISVPLFTNSTPVPDIGRYVTERVQAELVGRGNYRIQDSGADAVLTGEITSITVAPVSFNQQQQATRYVLTMTARIDFTDVKTGKILWSNPSMQFREEFEPTTGAEISDASAFLGQDVNALERITTEFARSAVSSILEAF